MKHSMHQKLVTAWVCTCSWMLSNVGLKYNLVQNRFCSCKTKRLIIHRQSADNSLIIHFRILQHVITAPLGRWWPFVAHVLSFNGSYNYINCTPFNETRETRIKRCESTKAKARKASELSSAISSFTAIRPSSKFGMTWQRAENCGNSVLFLAMYARLRHAVAFNGVTPLKLVHRRASYRPRYS